MTKIVSCRIEEILYDQFVEYVNNLNLTNNEVLTQLILIFNNVNNCLQHDISISIEERYELVKNEITEFLSRLNGGFE